MKRALVGNIRLTPEYNAETLNKELTRMADAINAMSTSVDQEVRRELSAVRKLSKTLRQNEPVVFWTEWFEDTATGEAVARMIFTSGWNNVADVQARYSTNRNIKDTDTWAGLFDSPTNMSVVTYTGADKDKYPEGKYYEFRLTMPAFSLAEKKTMFMAQLRAIDKTGKVLAFAENVFDTDKLGDVVTLDLNIGAWSSGTSKWEVLAIGNADLDANSVAFGAQAATDFDEDDNLLDADFGTATANLTATDKRFNQSLGTFDAETDVYVIARAYTETNKGGTAGNPPYIRQMITTPPAPGADGISPGDITASMLASSAQRAELNVSLSHKGYTALLEDTVTYSGSITWGDGTSYTLTSGELTAPTSALYYIFHDPDTDAGDLVISDPETELQITTDKTIANAITGRRILVGIMQEGTEDGEAAFFVSNTGEVAINAPYVYAAKLSALSADLGTINAGTIQVTATVEWGAVSGTTNAPEDGATLGASWLSNLSNIPIHLAESGTPSVSGLYATPSYMGYYDDTPVTGGWKTYMDISGNFGLDGAGADYLTWDAGTGTLTVAGQFNLLSGSDVDFDYVSGANKPENNATLGAVWGTNLGSIPGRFENDGDPGAAEPSGLYATDGYFGFWDQGSASWKTYMDSSGNFGLTGDAANYFTWNGSNISIFTEGTFRITNAATGNYAEIINGIYTAVGPSGTAYYDETGISFLTTNQAFYQTTTVHLINAASTFNIGPLSSGTTMSIGIGGISGASGGFDIAPSGTLSLKGAAWPADASGYLLNDGAGNLSWAAASGTTTFVGLTDTPSSFSTHGGKFVKVNSGATALEFVADPGYLTAESDPVFSASAAAGITGTNITNWNTAFGWGNHASAGYLTAETDPVFSASAAAGITATNITNWNSAYGWGNHALAGYLTSYTETDPVFVASPAYGITVANKNEWNSAYSHSLVTTGNPHSVSKSDVGLGSVENTALSTWPGTSFVTTVGTLGSGAIGGGFTAISDAYIASSTNWNNAYAWGDHASAGYLTAVTVNAGTGLSGGGTGSNLTISHADTSSASSLSTTNSTTIVGLTIDGFGHVTAISSQTIGISTSNISDISSGQVTNWDNAYAWGDHASAGYLADTDFSSDGIMARVAAGTYGTITDNSTNWNTAYGWGNHASAGYVEDVIAGNGITRSVAGANYTINHATGMPGVSTYSGSTGQFVNSITVDSFGHITAVGFATPP